MSSFEAPACPYCGAAWTAAMLQMLERHSGRVFCACCAGAPGAAHIGPLALPAQDLCCESCGKPIYRAPSAGVNATS